MTPQRSIRRWQGRYAMLRSVGKSRWRSLLVAVLPTRHYFRWLYRGNALTTNRQRIIREARRDRAYAEWLRIEDGPRPNGVDLRRPCR